MTSLHLDHAQYAVLLEGAASYMAAHPDENLEDMQKALERFNEQDEERIRQEHEQGLSIFGTQPPRVQFRAYMVDDATGLPVTLEPDIPKILDTDYLKKRNAGLPGGEPLVAELVKEYETQQARQVHDQQQMEAQAQAMLTGQMPQPAVFDPNASMKPYWFWPLLLVCRDMDFEIQQRKFGRLYRAEMRKAGAM